ncbi:MULTISPECIES: hypothetical protein [unclassified Microbacterium]|uniref:hypothetical protein n=1 Tax=unclassified Microbacterium TaxID=2609290 RepID=UPI001604F585|nr:MULTISPECIES: hypothetical protein [unclassified Microbacterium]QNA92829.1 hypothetical protein G4G29_11465 [Microbacterium sp. Se63.02b]QYM62974.1 hypothetical protein K1X59_11500 [Microbacterium sp. Se5.02b]
MLRIILLIVWLLLSAWLAIWVGEGLFGVDQRHSILPFAGEDTLGAPIIIGVAWGLLLTFGGMLSGLGRRRSVRGEAQIGVGTIVEVSRTGVTVNDVPQYDMFIRVTPSTAEEFIGQLRMLVDASEIGTLQVGLPVPVRYSLTDQDTVELADLSDPEVRDAMLQWRIDRGLIDPTQVRARTSGIPVPASVLEVRPTGRRREGQSELALRVLMAPEDAATWEADTTVFVYPQAIPHLQVGAPVWAYYRREDPQTVAVTIEKEATR